jgi:hypothetical protein
MKLTSAGHSEMVQWLPVLVPVQYNYIALFVIFKSTVFREAYKED